MDNTADQMFRLINGMREKWGLPPMTWEEFEELVNKDAESTE